MSKLHLSYTIYLYICTVTRLIHKEKNYFLFSRNRYTYEKEAKTTGTFKFVHE